MSRHPFIKCNHSYALRFVELTAQSRKFRTRVKSIIIKYFYYALFTLSLDSAPSGLVLSLNQHPEDACLVDLDGDLAGCHF